MKPRFKSRTSLFDRVLVLPLRWVRQLGGTVVEVREEGVVSEVDSLVSFPPSSHRFNFFSFSKGLSRYGVES